MNLDHDFVQVWKFSETKRKMQTEHFFSPNSSEDQKKKRYSARIEHFFPKFTLSCTPFQIIGRDAEVDHSQTMGGIQPNYLGDISAHPPRVSAPLPANTWIVSTFQEFFSHAISWAHFTYRHHRSKRDQTNDTKTLKKCGCQTIKPNSIIFILI